eukprot:TRINITY_DN6600_c0_g1_i1.p1 TRINITY_DN6600_c0_g1~~TRINITY_DN6600_c0_g1_i1.p1  ORF type:complete len:250 (-),score=44.35 TRINITY_DN6600_c0_g1_i1:262-1011(-)
MELAGLSADTLAALQQHMAEKEQGLVPTLDALHAASQESTLADLNVADFGSNEYWLARWQESSEAQEWFVIDVDKIWPWFGPICAELGLCGEDGAHKAVLELGAGTSRLALDLVIQHHVNGVVVTDLAREPMQMQATRASNELGAEDADRLTSYLVDDACRMQFRDGQFKLVFDKGTNDCIRISEDPEILPKFVSEVHRIIESGGYYVFVTCQHDPKLDPWFELFEVCETAVVLRDGPATTNIVVLHRT